MKRIRDLTEDEYEILFRAILTYQDDGPFPEGWKTLEAEKVQAIVDEAETVSASENPPLKG